MASNLSTIVETIEDINFTYETIDPVEIVPTAIQVTNESTGGWAGYTIFAIFCFVVFIHIVYNCISEITQHILIKP